MSQRSSQEITAQIKKLKQERTLMKLLEEKFPRERKSRFEKLPYDCMEKIYEYLHPAGLSRYRLAKALHKESIHYAISLKCFEENYLKEMMGCAAYGFKNVSEIPRKRANKLSSYLELNDTDKNTIIRQLVAKENSEMLLKIKTYTPMGGNRKRCGVFYKDNIIVISPKTILGFRSLRKCQDCPCRRNCCLLKGEEYYSSERDDGRITSGYREILLGNYVIPTTPITEEDEVIRIMQDSSGGKWAFIKFSVNSYTQRITDSGGYSDFTSASFSILIKRIK